MKSIIKIAQINLVALLVCCASNVIANEQPQKDITAITPAISLGQSLLPRLNQRLPNDPASSENSCTDKIDSCRALADAGVCATSKDAMVINCTRTCNFCDIL